MTDTPDVIHLRARRAAASWPPADATPATLYDFTSRRALPHTGVDAVTRFYVGDRVRLPGGEVARLLDFPVITRGDNPPRTEFLVQIEATGYRRLVRVADCERIDPPAAAPCDVGPLEGAGG